ncbi:GNAT family N-acetyltransferase [Pectobacterium parmentieri]|uniref:N-acetyltransferase n=1 Tax=Pectobacterium parmentieri TaxID=1905730 RepID=A0A8B3F8K2_PECPM|nr:GNAT family N-acetyltransferase [Pectobacterium parmentieri]ACX87904.1 GCN5-related N-acetyltransferase [Pectobacterium parmentieri WPP163]AOR58891.1 GCN5 family acetyltransferase [Pectobacterium parmentieri]AYH10074.1 N-acetyltransferase [Pectobacterium parmentieri]AYH19215.1 N-acetyltransferase [Pectobacterium parmentieri]AYH36394.1 N-acetyltransferase [Pectobacterium parmentieri]
MSVRYAMADEAERLWLIRNEAIRSGCQAVYDNETIMAFTPDTMPEGYRHAIINNPFFVIDDTILSLPVATGFLDITNNSVEAIFTLPNYQNKGLATKILDAIKNEAKTRGITVLTLSSTPNAVAFYQANGFSIDKQGEYYSGSAKRSLPCVDMSLDMRLYHIS